MNFLLHIAGDAILSYPHLCHLQHSSPSINTQQIKQREQSQHQNMLQSSKLIQSTTHHPPRSQTKPATQQTPPIKAQSSCKLSRRELAIFTNSSLLLATSQALLPGTSRGIGGDEQDNIQPQETLIQPEIVQLKEPSPEAVSSCINNNNNNNSNPPTKRAFLDISINGAAAGRIIIGVYEDSAPFTSSRFSNLITGRAGVSYRRKEFIKIMPNYVQHGGVRSYGVDAELAKRTGGDLKNDALKKEWERAKNECPGTRNLEGSVSIIVRDPLKPPSKTKLVARGGKLEMDEEEVGVEPNGTEFVICIKDSPELDDSALVIGRVVQGMDVVQRIGQVQTVQDNTSSPYFRVAKLIGDKRAVVAERGFNRPYSKVLITNCGLLD